MNPYSGKLIVFYGINNLGKSTQAKLLVKKLNNEGLVTEYLKYPIYNLEPSGRMLNDYLRNDNPLNLNAKEVQAIYALNRTQYQEELIKKLSSGINIVAEDYTGTGIAWGLGAGVSEKYLKDINSHLIKEDLAILFDGERFKQSIEEGHKHENNNDLISKVRWSHLKLREEYGWLKIDANLKINEIRDIVWDRVSSFLNKEKTEINNINKLEETIESAAKPQKEKYNYSGFNALGDIINNKHQTTYKDSIKLSEQESNIASEVIFPVVVNDLKIEEASNANKYTEIPVYQKETPAIPIKTRTISPPNILQVQKIRQDAKLPTKAHESDAGFDLYADSYYSIMPYGQTLVGTGIKMAIPSGHAGLIWDKSGLANLGITTMGGVIDCDYRGEIKIVVKNLSEDIFNITPGQKIAQIIIQETPDFKIIENQIDMDSKRGENGFGSSGNF